MTDTLLSLFDRQVERSPRRTALRYRSGGIWRGRSWNDWRTRSSRIAAWLCHHGLEHGDRVAILAETSIEWVEVDMGVLTAGAVTVPIYPTLQPDVVGAILRDCGARVVVASEPTQVAKLFHPDAGELPALERVVSLARVSRLERPDARGRLDVSLEDVVPDGVPSHVIDELIASRFEDSVLGERRAQVTPDSLAALYYTSGTSGDAKGVMLSHDNFVFETEALQAHMPVTSKDEQLLFLPLAHIVAKLTVMLQLRTGFVTSFAASIEEAAQDCAVVRPSFLVGVPRVYEKIQEGIERRVEERGDAQRRVVRWALSVGREVSAIRQRGGAVPTLLAMQASTAERLVFGQIKERLGGRIRFMLSGAAPLARETAEFFHALDLLILEGYGLTETTGATTLNTPERYRFGSVGPALDGVEVTLGDDGEVLVRGRSVTAGYWGDEALTRESFTEDGRLRTGDIGTIEDGFVVITDRKKDLIVTSGGKNIAPQRVEMRLTQSPYIDRAVVIGDRRKFPVALLVVNGAAVDAFAAKLGLRGGLTALLRHPKVSALLSNEVEAVNAGLASFERVKRFEVITGDLSVHEGTLTPTNKVRRDAVITRYADLVDNLYEGVTSDLSDIS